MSPQDYCKLCGAQVRLEGDDPVSIADEELERVQFERQDVLSEGWRMAHREAQGAWAMVEFLEAVRLRKMRDEERAAFQRLGGWCP